MTPETVTLPAFKPLPLPFTPTSTNEVLSGRYCWGERLASGQVVSVQADVRGGDAEIFVCVDDVVKIQRLQVPFDLATAEILCTAQELLRECLFYPSIPECGPDDDWFDWECVDDDDCPVLGQGERLPDPTTLELAGTTLRVEDGDSVAVVRIGVLAAHAWRRAHQLLQAA